MDRIQVHANAHVAFAVPEILAQILSYTVHRPSANEREDLLSCELKGRIAMQKQSPWPFLPICKRWHDTIKSTPALWSTFIALRKISSDRLPHIILVLEHHLRRSKSTPLTLAVYLSGSDFHGLYNARDSTLCAYLSRMLLKEVHRWQEVDLDIKGSRTTPWFGIDQSPVLRLQAEHLTDLRIHWHWWGVPIQFVPCPRLECMDLFLVSASKIESGQSQDNEQVKTPVYFPKLRTIRLYCHNVGGFEGAWAVLQQAGAAPIEELEIRAKFFRDDDTAPPVPPFSFSTLWRLSLPSCPFTITRQILSHFVLPSLTKLELGSLFLSNETLSKFTPLLRNLRLEALEMCFFDEFPSFNSNSLQELLQSLDSVRSITFRGVNEDFAFVSSLVTAFKEVFNQEQGLAFQVLLPQLSSLNLELEPMELYRGLYTATSTIQDFICVCKHKFDKFHFSLSFHEMSAIGADTQTKLLKALRTDIYILSYVTEDFCVTFNGIDVARK